MCVNYSKPLTMNKQDPHAFVVSVSSGKLDFMCCSTSSQLWANVGHRTWMNTKAVVLQNEVMRPLFDHCVCSDCPNRSWMLPTQNRPDRYQLVMTMTGVHPKRFCWRQTKNVLMNVKLNRLDMYQPKKVLMGYQIKIALLVINWKRLISADECQLKIGLICMLCESRTVLMVVNPANTKSSWRKHMCDRYEN